MKRRLSRVLAFSSMLCALVAGCNGDKSDPKAEAPPPLKVQRVEDRTLFQVDHPERFQLVQAVEHIAMPQLQVNGTVSSRHFESRARHFDCYGPSCGD